MSEQSTEPPSDSNKPTGWLAGVRAHMSAIAGSLDHEDWLYVAAIACVSIGTAWFVHPGAGLIAAGCMFVGWPLMARLCSQGKGPGQ